MCHDSGPRGHTLRILIVASEIEFYDFDLIVWKQTLQTIL